MVRDEIWSISLPRAVAFFRGQKDVIPSGPGQYTFRSCTVIVTELYSGSQSIWNIPRIRIRMDGSDEDVSNLYHRFFIQFLSAGG